jgi:hypothetical protein
VILVYRYRVKSLNGLLNRQSRAVNYIWNFCNDTQKHALKWSKKWPAGFDLNVLTTGSSKELSIHSGTVNATCEQYAKSRNQHRRPYLRYRVRKSLGWVPLKGRDLKREGDAFRFAGNTFRVFNSRPLPEGKSIAGLRTREWACGGCGVEHDRDTNAALNILRCGRASPGVGILSLYGEEDVKVIGSSSGFPTRLSTIRPR